MPPFPAGDALIWNDAELRALFESEDGPVVRYLLRKGLLVEASAKNYASGIGGGPRVRTNRLRSSISTRPGRDALGVYVDVGTNVEYARFVELGTIRNKPYPYLRPALAAAR